MQLLHFVGGNDDFPKIMGLPSSRGPMFGGKTLAPRSSGHRPRHGQLLLHSTRRERWKKVEYSFGYTHDSEGKLKIILHDSHVPFSGG